jgi:hypothetical protein
VSDTESAYRVGADVVARVRHFLHVVARGDVCGIVDLRSFIDDLLAKLFDGIWIPFEVLGSQFVDQLAKDVEVDVLNPVATELAEGDVAVGGRAGLVVEAAVFCQLRPVLVVRFSRWMP